ncbi:DUF2157 domain-containing protein [Oxalobacteraceae bacterium OM1]|nr:DUF2157 domain-containing protein [Oxalobacteraceae bacterium OM1]
MIHRRDLEAAVQAGVLNPLELEGLLAFLKTRHGRSPRGQSARFSGTHVLYYLGGMLAISAISVFTTLAVESLGMSALFALAVLYAIAAVAVASRLERHGHPIPSGIFAALAVALTPLAVFALQHVLGMWQTGAHTEHYRDFHRFIDWRWLAMECATLAAGALLLKRFRYPFLVMSIAVTVWYMGMDIVPALLLPDGGWTSPAAWELRKAILLAFGLVMLLLAFFVDLRTRHDKDFAFWLYLFGLLTFCGALSAIGSGALSGKLFYLAIHALLVFVGAVLSRRAFAVFGGIGIAVVLFDLSWHMFKNSFGFVIVLSVIGFALIGMGIWWGRHEARLATQLRALLPRELRELIEARAASIA